ncbi:MAG: cytochrome o ubiquinol oxidase subunit IV [Dongiaceae bacterium]
MSTAHHAGNGANHHDGAHGSVKSYVVGFILAVILTVIPFYLTMTGVLSGSTTLVVIVAMALIQIVVHLVFFLHMNGSSEQSWNTLAFLFTVLIVGILVVGSIWIMYHLNANMMPIPQNMG